MTVEFQTLQRVQQGLFHLTKGLAPFVEAKMQAKHGARWLHYASRAAGSAPNAPLDAYGLLKTLVDNWPEVFGPALPKHEQRKARSFANVALEGRNEASHNAGGLKDRDGLRYLDAMCGLLSAVKAAEEHQAAIRDLYEEQRRGGLAEPAATPPVAPKPTPADPAQVRLDLSVAPDAPARPWREVVLPRTDVLASTYQESEFAADLFAVSAGLVDKESDYATPQGFFGITYMTEGLRRVLAAALARLACTGGGEPVICLQTAFGGGKTHSMLAVWHLCHATSLDALKGVGELAREQGVAEWRPVSCFTFVGTAKGPAHALVERDGLKVRTLWGALALELAGMPGYRLVEASEQAGTNPGSALLVEVLKLAAPCAILLDEVVAYVRQLEGTPFEAFLGFCQSLTEAAKLVPGVLIVGSLPESKAEAGSEKGEAALLRLEKVFGRVQSPWLPATGHETYEIVRRRLFWDLQEDDIRLRDQAVKAFHDMYRRNKEEYPPEASDPKYLELMRLAYPIHPELFERLAKDWGTLERFQRTRGVLRFMASAIGVLWKAGANDPLITPARLPLFHERVRASALAPLPGEYAAVVDKEVDGDTSLPVRMESGNPSRRLAVARAATRAARAVFLGSMGQVAGNRRGINGRELRLACVEPGEQASLFGDALRELGEKATYLYEEGGRYWFATQPTLNRLAHDLAISLDPHEVDEAIRALLQRERDEAKGRFEQVFVAPDDPPAVDEARGLSLVVLGPQFPHSGRSAGDTAASRCVADTLTHCRSGQRRFKNTLLFLAPDENELVRAREAMRRWLAWSRIMADDKLRGQLSRAQEDDAKLKERQGAESARLAVRTAWTHLLYPERTEATEAGKAFDLGYTAFRFRDPGTFFPAVYQRALEDNLAREKLGSIILAREVGKYWPADARHLAVAEVEEWFLTYPYLPRLRDITVLRDTIRNAVAELDPPFGFAEGVGEDGGYKNLTWAKPAPFNLPPGAVIVRKDVALSLQPAAPAGTPAAPAATPTGGVVQGPRVPGATPVPPGPPSGAVTAAVEKETFTRFFGAVEIDPIRPIKSFEQVVIAVINELQRTPGAKVKLTLEIEATAEDGFSRDDMGVVRDNAQQLRFRAESTGFDR